MILVDVDDIFVGEKRTRLRKDDVMALLATQQRIQALVPGFKFNLGFSGKYFHHGSAEENLGDDMLLENVDRYVLFLYIFFSSYWYLDEIFPNIYVPFTR